VSAIKFTGPSDTIKFDFRKLPTPMVEWRGTAKDLHEILFKATIDAPSGNGWVRVDSGKLPGVGQNVHVWIVDDNSAIGGERREYIDTWDYDPSNAAWANGLITHWHPNVLPAPPQADAPQGEK